jgi:hypothetical protein
VVDRRGRASCRAHRRRLDHLPLPLSAGRGSATPTRCCADTVSPAAATSSTCTSATRWPARWHRAGSTRGSSTSGAATTAGRPGGHTSARSGRSNDFVFRDIPAAVEKVCALAEPMACSGSGPR